MSADKCPKCGAVLIDSDGWWHKYQCGTQVNEDDGYVRHSECRIAELRAELERVTKEWDLAIAHDTQPYPTAWAYEQACKALENAKTERDKAREQRDRAMEFADHKSECELHFMNPCDCGFREILEEIAEERRKK
jgi:uncharacterized Zn finger protein (UPF0148 family)